MPLVSSKKMVACIATSHMGTSTGPNDICKTPAPPAPVPPPLPYPNIATTATPGPGYTTKTMAIMTPMFVKGSKTALSNGDQPGVMMGLISSKIMGMCESLMVSTDVDAEGNGVTRTLDTCGSNS